MELAPRYNMDSTDFKTPEEMKQIILEENGVNLDSISGRKKIFKKIDVWMKVLSDIVNIERGKNK